MAAPVRDVHAPSERLSGNGVLRLEIDSGTTLNPAQRLRRGQGFSALPLTVRDGRPGERVAQIGFPRGPNVICPAIEWQPHADPVVVAENQERTAEIRMLQDVRN